MAGKVENHFFGKEKRKKKGFVFPEFKYSTFFRFGYWHALFICILFVVGGRGVGLNLSPWLVFNHG